MKYIFTLLSFSLFYVGNSQCEPTTTQMLLLGDSWAFFSWSGDSYNENFNRFGLSDIECYSNLTFAVNGAEANDYFEDSGRMDDLEDYIISHPELKVVHYSLGGNDAMGGWNNSMTQAQSDSLLDVIMQDIKSGIDTIHSFNPELDILISGYDFPNFAETISTLSSFLQWAHPFYGTWTDMGQPDPTELNEMLTVFTQRFIDSAAVWNHVDFVSNLGLMQYTYGQIDPLGVAPYGTYPPNYVSVPGGLLNYPSPLDALQLGGNDSFHLNDASYELFIKRHFEEFYWDYFRNADQTIYVSDVNLNGWTNGSISSDTELKVGNESGTALQTIIKFESSAIDDAMMVDEASIFIQMSDWVGDNLNTEALTVTISSNGFGADDFVSTDDYTDLGDVSAVCCVYGSTDESGHWMRIDLEDTLVSYIKAYQDVQIKLSYDNITESDRYFEFINDTESIFMDVNLSPLPLEVEEYQVNTDWSVYPNPATNEINIPLLSDQQTVSIFNLNGQLVQVENGAETIINIDNLTSGIYIIQIETAHQLWQTKFSKY